MDIKLPSLGEGADSGTVVNIFVKEGDSITKDQPVLELENEKAVASIPSTAAGVVCRIFVKVGDKLSVGQRILSLAGGDADSPATETRVAAPAVPSTSASGGVAANTAETGAAPSEDDAEPSSASPVASPSIRKLALELGIDLRRVRGSERGGRIGMADLRAYIQRLQEIAAITKSSAKVAPTAKPVAESVDFSKWGPVSRTPLSALRKVIRRRMAENWTAIPHVTQFDEADITALQELRKKHAPAYEQKGARLTLTPFLLKALVQTLQKHPIFNSSLDEATEEIVFKEYFHIGIAVDTEAGLIVPVIRNVDQKSLLELSKNLEALAQKARDRKVSADELKGGTFTVSNQGGIGGAHFTPIVNKPEVAILGLGRSAWKAVVREQQIVSRLMLPLALSYDHRVIDGGSAARFVVELVARIENFVTENLQP
ncbi:MAG: branched-chain alpha-keto acid dehydrogenase subunit E2 [Verrucomicrobia bacterium]|nr:branched-chain alpha-keto acid dehydrogenase subunit E2 [Verrucomicrobiota bacterium]